MFVALCFIVLDFEQEMPLEYLVLNFELAKGSTDSLDDMFELKEPLGIIIGKAFGGLGPLEVFLLLVQERQDLSNIGSCVVEHLAAQQKLYYILSRRFLVVLANMA